jgi:hypothetical protein
MRTAMRGVGLLVALLRADAYGSGAFGPEVARASRLLAAAIRVALWAFGGAGLGSVSGFFGSRWLAPGADEGRLPGILIGGLLGLLGGLAWGLWRERGRSSARAA